MGKTKSILTGPWVKKWLKICAIATATVGVVPSIYWVCCKVKQINDNTASFAKLETKVDKISSDTSEIKGEVHQQGELLKLLVPMRASK